jgi:hypothetical protein
MLSLYVCISFYVNCIKWTYFVAFSILASEHIVGPVNLSTKINRRQATTYLLLQINVRIRYKKTKDQQSNTDLATKR